MRRPLIQLCPVRKDKTDRDKCPLPLLSTNPIAFNSNTTDTCRRKIDVVVGVFMSSLAASRARSHAPHLPDDRQRGDCCSTAVRSKYW